MAEASFLRDALVYLGAAVVCVPIAKRIGLGAVLGYLFAGCAIGPGGLGFVTNVESILHFAEFGVVLMLVLIGLELDLKRLLEMRGAVFGGGALQMAACGAALVRHRSISAVTLKNRGVRIVTGRNHGPPGTNVLS